MSARFLKTILQHPKLPSTEIPGHVKDAVSGNLTENSALKYLWQYRKGSIRRRYATFGKGSGLKASICWPSIEELEYLKEYEKKFEKSFQYMNTKLQQQKAKDAEYRTKREKEVLANLKKLPQMKKEFWENYHNLYADIEENDSKKEKIIQEVREYLGYDIDSNDPRFEEALAKKDEDEKTAIKAARKLEKQKQNMEMLQAMVSEALEKEKETKKSAQPQESAKEDKKANN